MQDDILELYPDTGSHHSLQGLYLQQTFPQLPGEQPFIYSNFIASLDGRIAVPGSGRQSHQVPPAIANSRDWRLFQELAAHADLLITSGRYFRQTEASEAQADLPIGSGPEFDDLREWRIAQGYSPQPDIAVFSASLDLPVCSFARYADRKVLLITGGRTDDEKLREIIDNSHLQVVTCGDSGHVDGSLLRETLAGLGYRRVYAIAGPSVLHTLVMGGALDRLYHTTAHCLLGGTQFDTFVWGPQLDPAFRMPLLQSFYDPHAPDDTGQTLTIYGR
jgi:riboflavin biosynthesis pyrimidine reductase